MNFDTSNVQEAQGVESKYIKPGISDNVVIGDFTANTESSVPFIEGSFSVNDKTTSGRFYLPEGSSEEDIKSRDNHLARIKHIATKVVTAEEFDAAGKSSSNITQYAQNLTTLLKGKILRMKFGGKQMAGKDGKPNWDMAVIPFKRFAESMTIPREQSKLTYDPNNVYDYKPLPVATEINDLPFTV